jgi:ankyrin repeat protein
MSQPRFQKTSLSDELFSQIDQVDLQIFEFIQTQLEEKFAVFLQIKGESFEKYTQGVCNGLAFRNFIAAAIGESQVNIDRMNLILELSDQEIIELAYLHNEYTTLSRSLRAMNDTSEIGKMNKKIMDYQATLKMEIKSEMKMDLNLLRNKRENHINEVILSQFGEEKTDKICTAIEIYRFIHAVLGAQQPSKDLKISVNNSPIVEADFDKMLEVYAPDKILKQEFKVKKTFSISFNFSREELFNLFSNQYQKNTFHEGDLIILNCCDHAMFLTIQNKHFILYNPLPMTFTKTEMFIQALWMYLFSESARQKKFKYAELLIDIYQSTTSEKKFSIKPNRIDIIKQILTDDNDIERVSSSHNTLWTTAYFGHQDTFQYLLDNKANIHRHVGSAIPAAYNNHYHILERIYMVDPELLLEADDAEKTPLLHIAKFGNISFLKLMEYEILEVEYIAAAKVAIEYEREKFLEFLLKKKLVSSHDYHILAHEAVSHQNRSILTLLMLYGLDLKSNECSLASYAVANNLLISARFLGEHNALHEKNGATPFAIKAVEKDSIKMIHLLHEFKISLNAIDVESGYTAAHLAVQKKKLTMLQALAECKANFNIGDAKGQTALHLAVLQNDIPTIKLLIHYGANCHNEDAKQKTAIHYASRDIAYFMIMQQFKVFINAKYNNDNRPFYLSTCLKIINDSESTKQWENAFQMLRKRILDQYPYATKKQRIHPILIPPIKNEDIKYFKNLCVLLPSGGPLLPSVKIKKRKSTQF